MENTTCLPLQQHPQFGAALSRLGARVDYLDVDSAAPVLRIMRFGFSFVSRGPIWDRDTDTNAQISALRHAQMRLLNSDTPSPAILHQAGFRQIKTPAHVAELALTGTPADRVAQMHGKWRNIWRKAQRSALAIDHARFDPIAHGWLLDADLAQQRAKKYRSLPHAIIHHTDPKQVLVLTAWMGDTPVAAMLFIAHAPVVTYHIGWSNLTGRQHAAHYKLLMTAADKFAARGFRRLDLGTVDTEQAPGLARFKIGCGAKVRPLGGTWLRLGKRKAG